MLCGIALWSRSGSQHLEVSHGVTNTPSQEGYWLTQDDMVASNGVQ